MTNRLRDIAMERRAARWDAFYASVDTLIQQRPARTAIHAERLPVVRGQHDRGMQSIPIYKIIAAAPRFGVFDQWLMPHVVARRAYAPAERRAAYVQDVITLHQVGDSYFVKDGNLRVTQARDRGQLFLPAHVVEYTFQMPHDGRTRVYDLLLLQEHRDFFERTQDALMWPHQPVRCATLGNCQLLLRQIESYQATHTPYMTFADASRVWYDAVYAPLVKIIRKHNFGACFPLQTETDLYLWATQRAAEHASSPLMALRLLARLRRAIQQLNR